MSSISEELLVLQCQLAQLSNEYEAKATELRQRIADLAEREERELDEARVTMRATLEAAGLSQEAVDTAIRIHFGDEDITDVLTQGTPPKSRAKRGASTELQLLLKAHLDQSWKPLNDIVAETGIELTRARVAMAKLVQSGEVKTQGIGRWTKYSVE